MNTVRIMLNGRWYLLEAVAGSGATLCRHYKVARNRRPHTRLAHPFHAETGLFAFAHWPRTVHFGHLASSSHLSCLVHRKALEEMFV